MKQSKIYFSIAFLLAVSLTCQSKVYRVFYLGGQSNMDGYGYVKELPSDLSKTFEDVMIYQAQMAKDGEEPKGDGIWAKLKPGHGKDFKTDGKTNQYGERFGVELSFAQRMQELFPGESIALIKYSRGGTSIAIGASSAGCWDPDYSEKNGVNQWDHYLATLRGALQVEDIDGDGEKDQLIPTGIVWMQGESDGHSAEVAIKYGENLTQLMDMIRASLRHDKLPLVIGRISDSGKDEDGLVWDFGNVIRAAQEHFVENDPAAALVKTTDNYEYSDKWHYDSKGFIDLGIQFADEMSRLLQKKEK
jgi:hypothetical protein